ncbi:MAG: bifunctional 5,10-methylenetetrahydrofolate dehydrogenase/5,10-methenyltetrahydrofolate cyclohydrolase, partial [Candidatus Cloacimonetes bacterium]|nr:bifunctional 5,10-methylenetetrahydrofolate dehydrogenase/5,10-methenyltetrahydrofolate cyclohydrolase [Candidatus Cloacimonadota bacterium]
KKVAKKILEDLKVEVEKLSNIGVVPLLTIFMVGKDPASDYYSQNIIKNGNKLGIKINLVSLKKDIQEDELIKQIEDANVDSDAHGILLQMPLPFHLQADKVTMAINPEKDVDSLHPLNAGKLLLGKECFIPCTPAAVLELIKFYNINTDGSKVVILGRSNIVGKPLANLLLKKCKYANATVTVCHSHTKDLEEITKSADILISAIGRPYFVTENKVKKDSIIIDVGINRILDKDSKQYKFVGDIDYENVFEKVKAITPVPGGIGSITIATLMSNIIKATNISLKENK